MIKKITDILKKHNIDPSIELTTELSGLLSENIITEKYETLFNNSGILYHSLDMDGNITEVNQAWLKILEYEEKDVIGKWFGEFVDNEHVDLFVKQFKKLKNNKKIENLKLKLKKKNLEIILVLFNGCVIHAPDGESNYSLCFFNDITHEDTLLEELKASEKKYRRITENSPEITYINSLKRGAIYLLVIKN